ncbi:hypothetical protein [Paracoccus fistulariae]|uniref:Peptidase C-terminal archaeal/bacterial domain-containing protein n=1 Tax=Paracoccus fistulariae TaxID=658446 RepID=A0ABY7SMS1_9RHOB|nr:hypothetical protein [Paracoccus fistulariae]MDB6180091.1 hypothetical protein [Paracoccus fistulariae]WCR08179.1 hypothetical protein JHX87_05020 [Paracoccus fistulariae]
MSDTGFTKFFATVAAGCLAFGQPALAQEADTSVQLEPLGGTEEQAAGDDLMECADLGAARWIADNSDLSDVIFSEVPLSRQIAVTGNQQEVFAFVMSEDGTARIEARADEGDPMIQLVAADGTALAENDDTPSTLNSSLQKDLTAGRYCVVLSNIRSENMAATLQISRPEQPPLLNEESTASASATLVETCTPETEATALADGPLNAALAQGPVSVPADGTATSYFRFTLSEATPLTLRGTSQDLDPLIKLFGADGEMLAEDDDTEGTNARLDYADTLAAGDYCLGIAAYSAQPGDMTVLAEKLDREAFLRRAYQQGNLVPPMDGSFPMETIDLTSERRAVLLNSGGANWLRFTLDQPRMLVAHAQGEMLGVDTKLALFAERGDLIGQNDDNDRGSTDSTLGPVLLQPGRYAMAVSDLNREGPSEGGVVRPIGISLELYGLIQPEQAQ